MHESYFHCLVASRAACARNGALPTNVTDSAEPSGAITKSADTQPPVFVSLAIGGVIGSTFLMGCFVFRVLWNLVLCEEAGSTRELE